MENMKKFRKKLIIFGFIVVFLAGCQLFSLAQQKNPTVPSFKFPLKCTLGTDCWIIQYPDDDRSSDWHDYKGGKRTTDGHKGTDIGIANVEKMNQGVQVIAADDGIVLATRDGVTDINVKKIGESTVNNIGCGNRVAIKHGNGWVTDYCHMKKGSIAVKRGDRVLAGQTLGYVGMSGLTEFPHMHFQVQHLYDIIDPFSGNIVNNSSSMNYGNALWEAKTLRKITYYPEFIYNIGVENSVPKEDALESGEIKRSIINSSAEKIYLWAYVLAIKKGDIIQFTATNPAGHVVISNRFTIDKDNVRRFFYLTHKNNNKLIPGIYRYIVTLSRDNNIKYSKKINFAVK